MELTITINMDNAAFEDPDEVRRILKTIDGNHDQVLFDINGNKVGSVGLTDQTWDPPAVNEDDPRVVGDR